MLGNDTGVARQRALHQAQFDVRQPGQRTAGVVAALQYKASRSGHREIKVVACVLDEFKAERIDGKLETRPLTLQQVLAIQPRGAGNEL